MRKLALKRFKKSLNKGLGKVGTFIRVLWRDRAYLVMKVVFLLFFAATIKATSDPTLNTDVADMCVGVAGLLCIIPADRFVAGLLPEEESPRRKRRSNKEKEDDDV